MYETASSIKISNLPELPQKGDVSKCLDACGTTTELLEIVEAIGKKTCSLLMPGWDHETAVSFSEVNYV